MTFPPSFVFTGTAMGTSPRMTDILTGPIVVLLPSVSVTVASNSGEVFNWALVGVQVKVSPDNCMPLGTVTGVTVTVSPLGALVETVYV